MTVDAECWQTSEEKMAIIKTELGKLSVVRAHMRLNLVICVYRTIRLNGCSINTNVFFAENMPTTATIISGVYII